MFNFVKSGMIVDIIHRTIFPGIIEVSNGRIVSVKHKAQPKNAPYILPGFIDSHIHIESSMLIPSEFARLASVHGTVATVSDPHEIGNVLGIEGIRFMIENGKQVPFHFYFGASSCVPATRFETSGSEITANQIQELFHKDGLKYLSEMMNYPGVLNGNTEVMEKIRIAKNENRPIDGHAPGMRDPEAQRYIAAGITTDHECFTLEEALDKLSHGMHILIREGSAAKNYEALHTLLASHPDKVMFCSDDKHPHELVEGHINELVKRSIIEKKYDIFTVLRAASFNPIQHYYLDVGLLRTHDSADFILIDNLEDWNVLETYVKGELIAKEGKTLIEPIKSTTPNHFHVKPKNPKDFHVKALNNNINVIEALDGQLVTRKLVLPAKIVNGLYEPDIDRDILKIAVVNRYNDSPPAVAFIKNFGLKKGAIASCIAHDSHNIIAVGCNDDDICSAVNLIIENSGGISAVNKDEKHVLPLPIAGIMTNENGYIVGKKYAEIDEISKKLGSQLNAPFMTLSFMALLVIPEIKISDKGLFDCNIFDFIKLSIQ